MVMNALVATKLAFMVRLGIKGNVICLVAETITCFVVVVLEMKFLTFRI